LTKPDASHWTRILPSPLRGARHLGFGIDTETILGAALDLLG
jgi:hypothetical protein